MKLKVILMSLVACLWATTSQAALEMDDDTLKIGPKAGDVYFLKDNASAIPIEEIMTEETLAKFEPFAKPTPAFGFNTVAWVYIDVSNNAPKSLHRLLEISYPLLDDLKLYAVDESGTLIHKFETGDHRKFSERPIDDAHFIFPMDFPGDQTTRIYIKARSAGSVEVPIKIWDQNTYYKHRQQFVIIQGLYYGALLITLGYNLFVFLSVRSVSYLYYVLFVASFAVFSAVMRGFFFQFVIPDSPQLSDIVLPITLAVNLLCTIAFMVSFLRIKEKHPRLNRNLNRYSIFLGVLLVSGPFLPYHIMIPLLSLMAGLQCLFAFFLGFYEWKNGVKEARFFSLAWAFYSIGGVLLAFAKFGVIPTNAVTANAQQIGSILEILLLSLALADRLNTLQAENKRYIAELAKHVETVEALVNEKTRHIKSIMQYINQGIFTLLPEGLIGYRSSFLSKLYNDADKAEDAYKMITVGSGLPRESIDQAICTLESAFGEDPMQFELNSHLLPSEIHYENKTYEVDWSPMLNDDEEVEKVLVCIRDVTTIRELMAKDQQNVEMLKSINEIISLEEQKFNRFMDRTGRTLRACSELISEAYHQDDVRKILIHYHTVKGIARSLGLKRLSQTIHEAETDLIELKDHEGKHWDETRAREIQGTIIAAHNHYYTVARDKLNRGNTDMISIDVNDLQALAEDFGGAVADKIHDLFMVSSRELFAELAVQISTVADRLEKQVPLFKITGEEKKFSGETSDFLKDIFVHLIRNSLDHGIESSDERIRKGKIVQGMLTIDFRGDTITYQDDGAGLNLEKLKSMGLEKGLIEEGASRQTVAELIFNPGLSTADAVSDISGRGIGMDAVKEQIQENQGSIELVLDEDYDNSFVGFHFTIQVPGLISSYSDKEKKSA